MKKTLLKYTASTIVISMLLIVPVFADIDRCNKDDRFCVEPENIGKQIYNSRVDKRIFDTIAPNTEYRDIADEVLVLEQGLEKSETSAEDFASGEHNLTIQEQKKIDVFVKRLNKKDIDRVEIIGHADTQPFKKNSKSLYKDNKSLSIGRANEVAKYLKKSLDAPVYVLGNSNNQPVVFCSAIDIEIQKYKNCLAPNRRVEIFIWYKNKTKPCKFGQKPSNANLPFRISIDGEPLTIGDGANSADITRCEDKALEKADIQVRFDPLSKSQSLNITAVPRAVARGDDVEFVPYTNYKNYIDRAELRIFEDGKSIRHKPLIVVNLENSFQKSVSWTIPETLKGHKLQYILRVYNKAGKFDETSPLTLRIVDKSRKIDDLKPADKEELSGYGENHLAIRNIPVSGGIVTVNGSKLITGTKVQVMGSDVPVDKNGRFAYRQIMQAGTQSVNIMTETPDGTRAEFTRSIYIPDQDWFYIALADLTVGKNNVKGPAVLVKGDNSNKNKGDAFVDGRLAFYAKGKIKGKWLLTSSADTKEQPLEDLFSNFTNKDPRYLLKRIDPNAYYPIYGDDSTTIEDAPTQGKFYVRLERDKSHVLWGNFKTKINGTDLFNYSRTLYGANAEYSSFNVTNFGESKTAINGFAADPGSISSLEEFRGTGGSLYYLRGQDLVLGSERLRVETRDQDSGIVLDSKTLVYGQDYEINYLQGRIILREPLRSTSTSDTVVQTGSLSGNPVFLVAGYEYSPSITDVKNLTKGGRASHWFNDYLRLGITGYDQKRSGFNQQLMGVDATIRYTESTYLKLEKGRSIGAGNGAFSSLNGGFNFDTINQTTTTNIKADAHHIEAAIGLSDITKGKADGIINAYTLLRENGFSSPGQLTSEKIIQHGFKADIPINDKVSLMTKADYKSGKTTGKIVTGEVIGRMKLNNENSFDIAIRRDDRNNALSGGASTSLSRVGNRTDVALKYLYAPLDGEGKKERYEIYGLGQATIDKSSGRNRNNRIGLGGRYDLNDRISLTGDSTLGSGGWGGQIGAEYAKSDRTSYYVNYIVDTDRSDLGYRGNNSTFTLGGKSRYTDSLSVFAEERYQTFDNGSSGLIHSFGLDLISSDRWTWGGRFENGTISDTTTGDIDRTAVSLSSSYKYDKTRYSSTAELRLEDGSLAGDRTSWLFKNNLGYQTNENWRFLGDFDFAISSSGLNNTLDADFIEVGLGYAYRPVLNDKFNALFKYKYLQDTSSPGQLASNGSSAANDFEQRSHVLSADAIYDLTPKLSLGGKVGYRFGEIKDTTVIGSGFFDSQAVLLIGRADYHIVKEWDIVGELRYLGVKEAKDSKFGALVATYRHLNQNVKMGVGYNFTDFSDDLTNLDYTSNGAFFNIIGKF